jgi:hypothetical protein
VTETQAIEAMYYPRIEFPSVGWVKAALLYWDSLIRIVPDGMTPRDPPEVQQLVDARLIRNISPAPFRASASDVFGVRLEDLLQARKGKPIEDEWCAGDSAEDTARLVHLTQMERGLARELEGRKLLTASGEWARMSPAVARLFQITMATEAAQQLVAAPVTDSPACDVAAAYFAVAKVASDPGSVAPDGLRFARLHLPFPSPDAAARIPVAAIIELRSKYANARQTLRQTIQQRAAEIATLPSEEAIRRHIEALARDLCDELDLQRAHLRAARVKDAWTVIGVSAPVSAVSTGALASPAAILTAAGTFGTVGFGLLDWYHHQRLRRRHEESYLLTLQRGIDSRRRHEELRGWMRRLIPRSA